MQDTVCQHKPCSRCQARGQVPGPSRLCLCEGHGGPGQRARGKQRLGAGALGMCVLSVGALRDSAYGSAPGAC